MMRRSWLECLPPSSRRLGGAVLLLLVAAAVTQLSHRPGQWLAGWLPSSELVFELAAERAPTPRRVAAISDFRAVGCRPSDRTALPPAVYHEWTVRAPTAQVYTCRFRFVRPSRELSERRVDYDDLLPAVLGPEASTVVAKGLVVWSIRRAPFGIPALNRLLPVVTNLLLVLLVAGLLRINLLTDARQTLAGLRAGGRARRLPLITLIAAPSLLGLLHPLLLKWLGGSPMPLLFSIWTPPGVDDWVHAFAVGIAAPVTEELVFRVWMIPFLSRGMNPHLAIALSSALFAYAHGHAFVFFALSGLAFGYLWQYTRSATLCIYAHVLCNSQAVIEPLLRSLMA